MDDKNSTGGHRCYRTVSVRAVSIKNYEQLQAENKRLEAVLQKISRVNAMDYEYQRWARKALEGK